MWTGSCITRVSNPFSDCNTFANQYVKWQIPTGPDSSSSRKRWYKHSKQTEILLFIDNNIVFLFATQKRVKLPASINKQREKGIDGKKKNSEREECEPIIMRLIVTERRKEMCVNVKRAGRFLSFVSHRFVVVFHCCVNFLLSFSIFLSMLCVVLASFSAALSFFYLVLSVPFLSLFPFLKVTYFLSSVPSLFYGSHSLSLSYQPCFSVPLSFFHSPPLLSSPHSLSLLLHKTKLL